MASTTLDSLNGLYKEVSGELINAVPESGVLLKLAKFRASDRIGDSFHEPVILTHEHGYTYGGTTGDDFALEDAVAMTMKDAVIGAYNYVMSSALSYAAASRAAKSGKQAFKSAVAVLLANAAESASKRLEISALYGQKGIGDVADTGSSVETTSTTATLTFTAASWAPGIWSGLEGAKVNFYDLDDDSTLISSGADAIFTVTSVVNSTRTVVFTGTSGGIDALDTAVQDGGVRCYFKGSKTADMLGLKGVIENTGSLFGIDASAYGLWRGNTRVVGGKLTMDEVLSATSDLVGRGLMGPVTLMCAPATWKDLNAEQAALRVFDESYSSSKFETGASEIVYHGQNGKISVVSNPCVKAGDAFIFQPDDVRRIGSAENDNNLATQDENPFFALPSNAGFGVRWFSDQAIYVRRPARSMTLTGIVNDS